MDRGWKKTCSMCGAYNPPYCLNIELMPGCEARREKPLKVDPDGWCAYWQKERKTTFNGKKLAGVE